MKKHRLNVTDPQLDELIQKLIKHLGYDTEESINAIKNIVYYWALIQSR